MKRKEHLKIILENFDELYFTHIHVRSHFPFISPDLIGSTIIPSIEFYKIHGYSYSIQLDKKITKEMAESFNKRSHWLNQNFIIRLYAFLNSHNYVGNEESKIVINFEAKGSKEVNFVRRLRNIFAHASGFYNKKRKDHRNLLNEIKEYFNENSELTEFPLTINKVILPLFQGCRAYIIENY